MAEQCLHSCTQPMYSGTECVGRRCKVCRVLLLATPPGPTARLEEAEADLRALREAAWPFLLMAELVGAEYSSAEYVVWLRGKDANGQIHEAGLQWGDLRRLAELVEGK